ncbi:MAG TPA: tetratricopeptide repeat protein [Polyangiales bacterium]|nr:tetratricopeptide repeat protein [Polyangiales bacterium]
MTPEDPLEALRRELADLDSAVLAALTAPIGADLQARVVARVSADQRGRKWRRRCSLAAAAAACLVAVWMRLGVADDAVVLSRQAESARDQQHYARAAQLLQRALEIRERTLGPQHTEVAANLTELADLYRSQSLTAKAEPLYRRAFAIQPTAVF